MEIKDLFDTGGAIMDAVNDAVSSNDYSALSGKIRIRCRMPRKP